MDNTGRANGAEEQPTSWYYEAKVRDAQIRIFERSAEPDTDDASDVEVCNRGGTGYRL